MPAASNQWTNVNKMRAIPVDELLIRYRSSSVDRLAKELKVARGTLRKYLKTVGISQNSEGTRFQYTDAFRKKVVAAYERGEGTLKQLAAKYGVESDITIGRWVHKYGEVGLTAHNRKELYLMVVKLKKEIFKLREELANERTSRSKSAA